MDAAEKLLEKMRRTKTGWKFDDLCKLYEGFGFVKKEGGKHCLFKHPQYPSLRATVARHRVLKIGYIQDAIERIDQLKNFKGGANE